MRELNIGTKEHTKVTVMDEPSHGNACHEYQVLETTQKDGFNVLLADICFQKGPIKEHGVNGIHNEDLIAIVMDRLNGFQNGDYACDDNVTAYVNLGNALDALKKRTNSRKRQGIEGTSEKGYASLGYRPDNTDVEDKAREDGAAIYGKPAIQDTPLFIRAELQALMQRCVGLAMNDLAPVWCRGYTALFDALDHLDAMLARSEDK